MSRTIYKYRMLLHGVTTLELPEGAKLVHAASGGDTIGPLVAWFDVDPDAALEERTFYIYGTGHEINPEHRHLATVFSGPFVWHVFEPGGEE